MADCGIPIGNTGFLNCMLVRGVTRGMIFTSYRDSTGVINTIKSGDVPWTDDTFVDGKINEADDTKRWFPMPSVDNVAEVRGDDLNQTLNSGEEVFIQQGVKTFNGIYIELGTDYLDKLQALQCQKEAGVYLVDLQGELVGMKTADGSVAPILIKNLRFKEVPGSDSEIGAISVSFNYDRKEKDENLRMLTTSAGDVDLLAKRGLLDVFGAPATAIVATGFKMALTYCFGDNFDTDKVTGLVLADFALQNITDDLVVTILTVDELPEGTYEFTFVTQTGKTLELDVVLAGFDGTELQKTQIVIP